MLGFLNKKKDGSKDKKKKSASNLSKQVYIYRPIGQSQRFFVFGLHWEVILGNELDRQAYKTARKKKANYYVRGTTRSNVVGLLRSNKENGHPDLNVELYSMGAVFARTLPQGSFVMRFQTPKGIWFLMVHDGVVQEGTDCFYETLEEIEEQIEIFRAQWPSLLVYGDQEGDLAVPELSALTGQINSQTRLKRASINLASVPRWVWLLMVLFASYQGYEYAMKEWKKYKKERERAFMAQVRVDPIQEWWEIINSWAGKTPVLGKEGLQAWANGISEIPAYVGRWELDRLFCEGSGRCTGYYRRMPLGVLDSFKEFMPKHWEFESLGLDQLRVSFNIPIPSVTISDIGLGSLPDAEPTKWDELNLFQRITPIIREVRLNQAEPVKFDPPRQRKIDGGTDIIPFPKDSSLILPFVSRFEASMPLRSLIMLDWKENYIINRLEVKRITSDINKSSSMFELFVDGGFYVK